MTARSGATASHGDVALTDRQIAARILPLLAACALGLVPFTVYSNFLVDITRESGQGAPLMGWLRGTGGVAALVVGVCCAPLLDRVSRGVAAAGALAVLALACLLGVLGSVWSWAVFCLLVGAGTAVLNPAVSAMAADRFRDEATSGRAATQVSATMTLTAMLAAPLLAGPALLWGWRGDLVATAVLAVATAWLLLRHAVRGPGRETSTPPSAPTGYVAGLRVAWTLPGVPALLLVSTLRTTAFMGQLAYLAVVYWQRFAVGPGVFSLVWTLSGLAFFLGNWFGGRALRSQPSARCAAWIACAAALVGTGAVLAVFLAPVLPVALLATAVLAASHAVVAAVVTTVLVRASSGHRGTVLGLNGAGQSLGVCLGATVAGAGLAAAGWEGAGTALALVTLLAALAAGRAAGVLGGPARSGQHAGGTP
ncbi:MFS transporter [Kocuria tytonicola]|uniref:MFS transporter n=1 Tax=Kocuria tytonicola TaxID=2055946 RepID=UPI000EF8C9DD|nr:MFS transporter [Kocuria tytonicola]RLZ04392.1 MFS transporter [Kocuria tytonicola]